MAFQRVAISCSAFRYFTINRVNLILALTDNQSINVPSPQWRSTAIGLQHSLFLALVLTRYLLFFNLLIFLPTYIVIGLSLIFLRLVPLQHGFHLSSKAPISSLLTTKLSIIHIHVLLLESRCEAACGCRKEGQRATNVEVDTGRILDMRVH